MGKKSLVTRFEVFIEAKIHLMHIRHYGMEAYGGGAGCGGIATLKFNMDRRKGYVATMSQAPYSQGKGPDYPLNKRLGGAQGRPEPCVEINLLSFLEIM